MTVRNNKMKKLTVKTIIKELKQRGFRQITKEDINIWAIILLLEKWIKK